MKIVPQNRKTTNKSLASQTAKVERKANSNQKERLGFASKLTTGAGRSTIGIHSNYRSRDKPINNKVTNAHQK